MYKNFFYKSPAAPSHLKIITTFFIQHHSRSSICVSQHSSFHPIYKLLLSLRRFLLRRFLRKAKPIPNLPFHIYETTGKISKGSGLAVQRVPLPKKPPETARQVFVKVPFPDAVTCSLHSCRKETISVMTYWVRACRGKS